MDTAGATVDTQLAKALSHPVRVRALQILGERVASPGEIARAIEVPVANVGYHVSVLLRLECIEEVERRCVRGSVERFYRAVRRPHVPSARLEALPAGAPSSWMSQLVAEAFGDLRAAIESEQAGRRTGGDGSWTRLRLDDEGWKDLYDVLLATRHRALEIEAESVARLTAGGP